jgi:hypothetical protein
MTQNTVCTLSADEGALTSNMTTTTYCQCHPALFLQDASLFLAPDEAVPADSSITGQSRVTYSRLPCSLLLKITPLSYTAQTHTHTHTHTHTEVRFTLSATSEEEMAMLVKLLDIAEAAGSHP